VHTQILRSHVEVLFRGIDENGNHYFLCREDSKLLYYSFKIWADVAFAQTNSDKTLFPELYILRVRKDLGNNTIIGVPAALF